jgi:hypothetical protein
MLLSAIVLDDAERELKRDMQIQFSLDKEGRGGLSYVNPAARALAARPGFPPRKGPPIAR